MARDRGPEFSERARYVLFMSTRLTLWSSRCHWALLGAGVALLLSTIICEDFHQ